MNTSRDFWRNPLVGFAPQRNGHFAQKHRSESEPWILKYQDSCGDFFYVKDTVRVRNPSNFQRHPGLETFPTTKPVQKNLARRHLRVAGAAPGRLGDGNGLRLLGTDSSWGGTFQLFHFSTQYEVSRFFN